MERLLVSNSADKYAAEKGTPGTAEAALNSSLLGLGALAIYGMNGDKEVLLTEVAATGANNVNADDFVGDWIKLAIGTDTEPEVAHPIDVAGVKRILTVAHSAPVYHSIVITTAPAASTTKRDEYAIRIAYQNGALHNETISYSVQGVFSTQNALNTAIAKRINDDQVNPFTASVNGTNNLVITTTQVGLVFEFGYYGDFASDPTGVVTNAQTDITTKELLKNLERKLLAHKGTADQVTSYVPRLGGQVRDDLDYVVYVIEFKNGDFPKGSIKEHFDTEGRLYIAVNNVDVGITNATVGAPGNNILAFEQIMKTLFPSKFTRLTS